MQAQAAFDPLAKIVWSTREWARLLRSGGRPGGTCWVVRAGRAPFCIATRSRQPAGLHDSHLLDVDDDPLPAQQLDHVSQGQGKARGQLEL